MYSGEYDELDSVPKYHILERLSKTQNESDKERLRCFAFSVKMQADERM